nr:hypothetical protein [Myxococcota bacterium]
IETRRFELRDFGLLFGTYLVNGLILGSCGILVLLRGRPGSGARATVPFLLVGAAWGLTALDLYGPSALFRLHAAFESFLFAASLHMALGFPRPGRGIRPEILVATYLVAGALAVAYQIALPHPDAYVQLHLAATSAAGAALLALLGIQGTRYVLEHRSGVRREMRGLGLGALLAVVPIIALMIAESFTGGKAAQNAVGLTAFLFALAVSHAALRARAHESV